MVNALLGAHVTAAVLTWSEVEEQVIAVTCAAFDFVTCPRRAIALQHLTYHIQSPFRGTSASDLGDCHDRKCSICR